MMKATLFGTVILLLGFIYGCTELINYNVSPEKPVGSVKIILTDAPFPSDLVEKVNVTIDQVKFKVTKTNEGMEDESDFVFLDVNKTFNLLELGNGETEILGDLDIPVGEYSEIRMHVITAKIKLKDVATEMNIKIPGGSNSGLKIKINPSLVVTEKVAYQILLDFDVSQSFIVQGNSGKNVISKKEEITGFLFKPVIRAVNVASAGELSGIVKADDKNETSGFIKNAHIFVISPENPDNIIATGKTNSAGFYKIIGIPAGTYKVICEKEGYDKRKEPTVVEIKAREKTTLDFLLKKSV